LHILTLVSKLITEDLFLPPFSTCRISTQVPFVKSLLFENLDLEPSRRRPSVSHRESPPTWKSREFTEIQLSYLFVVKYIRPCINSSTAVAPRSRTFLTTAACRQSTTKLLRPQITKIQIKSSNIRTTARNYRRLYRPNSQLRI